MKNPPSFITRELQAGEKIKWFGQPGRKTVLMLTSPVTLAAFAGLLSFAYTHPLRSFGQQAIGLLFTFLEYWPYVALPVVMLAPLYFLLTAINTYYVVTNKRVLQFTKSLIPSPDARTTVSTRSLDSTYGRLKDRLFGTNTICWSTDNNPRSTTWSRETNLLYFHGLSETDREAIKKACPDSFIDQDFVVRGHGEIAPVDELPSRIGGPCRTLEQCMLDGERIVHMDDIPSKLISKNPTATLIQVGLLFSVPFIIWIGVVVIFEFVKGEPLTLLLVNCSLPAICIGIVFYLVKANKQFFDQIALERRVIITNYRLFNAASAEDMAEGKWTGYKMLDTLFADQLYATTGRASNVDYIDFFCVNTNFSNGNSDETHAFSSRRIWVTDLKTSYQSLPEFLRNGEFPQRASKEGQSSLHTRAIIYLAEKKERLGEKYPSETERLPKKKL